MVPCLVDLVFVVHLDRSGVSRTWAVLVAFCLWLWYAGIRKELSFSAASNGMRLALSTGGSFYAL